MIITKQAAVERFKVESKNLNSGDQRNLIREILQETILCHMKQINLFDDLAFHGGTSLRILHRIERFSEDLDLSLIKPNKRYSFAEKMIQLSDSLQKSDFNFEFQNKCKLENPIKKFFITDAVFLNDFRNQLGDVISGEKIKIKLELDTEPADHQQFEQVEIKSRFSAKINAHNLSTCMGQKIHAVLCRGESYGMDIVKGRDLYDLEWYLNKNIKPNLKNLSSCLNRSGPWKEQQLNIDFQWIISSIEKCLSTKNFDAILLDIRPLVSADVFGQLKSKWCLNYFKKMIQNLEHSKN